MSELKNRKNKKGNSLIEIICASALFLIFAVVIGFISLSSNKLRITNNELQNSIHFAEGIRNQFIYNLSYAEVRSILDSNKSYIEDNKINLDYINQSNINNILLENRPENEYYTEIIISEHQTIPDILEVKLKIITKEDKNVLEYCFYKGLYFEE